MVKRDPDQLLSALSKHLKAQQKGVLRITIKRGGLWKKQFTKTHSRKSKQILKQKLKTESNQQTVYPLITRIKTGQQKYNTEIALNKSSKFIESLLSIFRVNFFQKKVQKGAKIKKQPTKMNVNSKSSKKKLQKKKRNRQRRLKRESIKKQLKKQKQTKNK